jgi:cytochrome c peroxidase
MSSGWARTAGIAGIFGLLCSGLIWSSEALQPLPQSVPYDRQKALLGRRLFLEKRLSRGQDVACVSCHQPDKGGADGKRRSTEVNAPTVYNAIYNFRQFWNGRPADLVAQAAGPFHNPAEMAMDPAQVEQRLSEDAEYPQAFKGVYGKERIEFNDVIDAILEFEKALITPNAKFDLYLRGEAELSKLEAHGYRLFLSLGCVACHNGLCIGGNSFQYLGAVQPLPHDVDKGDRFDLTQDPFDRNRFKVPSLRNIELTAPYLHDGSQDTLEQVLRLMAYHNLGFDLSQQQVKELSGFLRTLTGERPAIWDVR